MSEWVMKLSIVERYGSRSYHRAVNIPLTTFGERLVDDMKAGWAFNGPVAFEHTVAILK